jgi:hypothetical protein
MNKAIDGWEAAKKRFQAKYFASTLYRKFLPETKNVRDNTIKFTREQIADLRALVSIAVWIRSEQLAQRDVVRLLNTVDPARWVSLPTPATQIDTRALMVAYCVADQENAIKWWTRLDAMLKVLGATDLDPTWRRHDDPSKTVHPDP